MIEPPRSTFYYRSTAARGCQEDASIGELIESTQDEFPGYGCRRLTREWIQSDSRWSSRRSSIQPTARSLAATK